jgi:hypothetical protein
VSAELPEPPLLFEANKVLDVLAAAADRNYDEVVVLGMKDGRAYLHHSRFASGYQLVGALADIQHQILERE